jgi:Fe-S cluster assembly protein SufD
MQINELNEKYIKNLEALFASKKEETIQDSLTSFKKHGLPTTKLENWKYTALSKFLPDELEFTKSPGTAKTPETTFGQATLIFSNGILNVDQLPEGIKVKEESFQTAYNRGHEDQLENLNKLGNSLQKSYVLTISKDLELDLINSFSNEHTNKVLISPRVQINITSSKTVKFFQQYHTTNNSAWINPTFSLNIEKNSNIEWNLNSFLSADNILTNRMQVELERDATFTYTQNFNNEKLSRTDFIVNLNGENATADLGGFYQLNDVQHHDTSLIINHHKSHTYSHQLFKGILDDQSRGVFNGMVYIHKDAQQIDANQLNKNLLLSKKAHVDTRPQLQVYADDVKAAHGATIGQLDPDELFYLTARGIPQEQATKLLLAGYGQQVFEKVSNQAWKDQVEQQNQKRS